MFYIFASALSVVPAYASNSKMGGNYELATIVEQDSLSDEELLIELSAVEKREIVEEQKDVAEALAAADANGGISEEAVDEIFKELYTTAPAVIEESLDNDYPLVYKENPLILAAELDMPTKVYEVNDEGTVTFASDYIDISVYTIEPGESAANEVLRDLGSINTGRTLWDLLRDLFVRPAYAATKTTKLYSVTHYLATTSGTRMVTTYVKGQFVYDGTTVTGTVYDHYMKANGMAGMIIGISGTSFGVVGTSAKRTAYQSGYAKVGLTVAGYGIVFLNYYVRAEANCTKAGVCTPTYVVSGG